MIYYSPTFQILVWKIPKTIGKMWSSAGANRGKKSLNLLLIVIHFNGAKGKLAAGSLRTCYQMLTIPVGCPLSDIASRFTVSGSNRHTLPWIWVMFFTSGWTGGGFRLQLLEPRAGKWKMGITAKRRFSICRSQIIWNWSWHSQANRLRIKGIVTVARVLGFSTISLK